MRVLSVLCVLALIGLLALGRDAREDDPGIRAEGLGGAAGGPAFGLAPADPEACPDPFEPVWIAIDVDDPAAGGVVEYFGRADRSAFDALIAGSLEGYLRLDEVFWLFEDGQVERLDEDFAYAGTSFFRVEAIRRITLLKEGFPEAARQLMPGDRIIPGPGRDA